MRGTATEQIKKLLGFPLEQAYRARIDEKLVEDSYSNEIMIGSVIMISQVLMILSSFLHRASDDMERRSMYLTLYTVLLVMTLLFLVAESQLYRKRNYKPALHAGISFAYTFLICLWSCGITLLDQFEGSNFSVFGYVVMAAAVFCNLKPWQSLAVFGSAFAMQNSLMYIYRDSPVIFREPPNFFGCMVNSFFVCVLAVVVAITLYRYRVNNLHKQILINEQYEEICQINARLNDLAMKDQLTALGNRRYLDVKMGEMDAGKQPGQITGMMLDIDFFKQYNDRYGHQGGDSCLKEVASILLEFVSGRDAFAVRYGGEEFFICLKDCTEPEEETEALRKMIADCHIDRDDLPDGYVSVSIGVDVERDWTEIGQDEFLRRCDQALYHAKNNGRNRISCYWKCGRGETEEA